MAVRPTFDSIAPTTTPEFHGGYGRTGPRTFDIDKHILPAAVAGIRRAFTLAKANRSTGWRTLQRHGDLDERRAVAASRGEVDIFKRRTGHAAVRVNCAVVIDDSGSMQSSGATIRVPGSTAKMRATNRTAAAIFGGTIAKALGAIPTVRLNVYQHGAYYGNRTYIKWRWTRGTPMGVFNEQAGGRNGAPGGGNADGFVLMAIAERLLRETRSNERAVIMMVSDGLPSIYSTTGTGTTGEALIDAVAWCRAKGITVLGVAIDGSDQSNYYGEGYIRFTGDWVALGTDLAKVLGHALQRR
jgi:hypothetical protein